MKQRYSYGYEDENVYGWVGKGREGEGASGRDEADEAERCFPRRVGREVWREKLDGDGVWAWLNVGEDDGRNTDGPAEVPPTSESDTC